MERNIKITLDGDQWCALIGVNLQVGISGFGGTREEALRNLKANPKYRKVT